MSDIKLFQINSNNVTELEGKSVTIEKTLQNFTWLSRTLPSADRHFLTEVKSTNAKSRSGW